MQHKRYTDADINQTDLYVNSRVVTDTIKLAKKTRDAIADINEFGCLSRIHPVEGNDEIYTGIVALRKIFFELTPIKNKHTMTML